MWPIVLGFSFGIFMLVCGLCFIAWAAREHHFANKYREVLEAYNRMDHTKVGPGWSVVYKDKKGSQQTILVPGIMDESAMLKELVKLNVPLNRIVSSNRVG